MDDTRKQALIAEAEKHLAEAFADDIHGTLQSLSEHGTLEHKTDEEFQFIYDQQFQVKVEVVK